MPNLTNAVAVLGSFLFFISKPNTLNHTTEFNSIILFKKEALTSLDYKGIILDRHLVFDSP